MGSKFTVLLYFLYCWQDMNSFTIEGTAGNEKYLHKRTGRQFLSCLEYRRNQNLTLCNCFSGAPAKIVICFLEVCYYGCYQFVTLNFNESMLMVHSPPICYQLVTSNLQAMLLKFSTNVLHYCLCSLRGPEEYTLYAKPKMYC